MFRFERYDKQVRLVVDADVPNYERRGFWFYWDAASAEFAGLLVDLFRKVLQQHYNYLQNKWYEQGWNDAKAKRAKGASKYWE